jgi:hypothetical protein
MNEKLDQLIQKFETYGDQVLTFLIILVALMFIGMALLIHNPYIKAVILAYIVLP